MFPLAEVRCLYLAILLFSHGSQAMTNIELSSQPSESLADTSLSRRSLANIIAGCVSVTFFVTWASVHPNALPITRSTRTGPLSDYKENLNNFYKTFTTRLFALFATVIAPELVIAWSLQQWFAAREITRQYTDDNKFEGTEDVPSHLLWKIQQWFATRKLKEEYKGKSIKDETYKGPEREWAMAHSHLLAMGGLALVDPTLPHGRQILTPELFARLLRDSTIQFPAITEEEIADKSIADGFTKMIATVQLIWFMLQCFVRHIQELAITELELTTLALVSVGLFAYIFWWAKPLGLREPFRVHLIHRTQPDVLRVEKNLGEEIENQTLSTQLYSKRRLSKLGIVDCTAVSYGATEVPFFYCPITRNGIYGRIVGFAILGALFGGVHCIAWNFIFPTDAEQVVWRVTSLFITVTPSFISLIDFRLYKISEKQGIEGDASTGELPVPHVSESPEIKKDDTGVDIEAIRRDASKGIPRFNPIKTIEFDLLDFTMTFVFVMYMLARLSLFLQAIVLLRQQPPSVFLTVTWTKFLPHISTFS